MILIALFCSSQEVLRKANDRCHKLLGLIGSPRTPSSPCSAALGETAQVTSKRYSVYYYAAMYSVYVNINTSQYISLLYY